MFSIRPIIQLYVQIQILYFASPDRIPVKNRSLIHMFVKILSWIRNRKEILSRAKADPDRDLINPLMHVRFSDRIIQNLTKKVKNFQV